jgi:hypothetical protein
MFSNNGRYIHSGANNKGHGLSYDLRQARSADCPAGMAASGVQTTWTPNSPSRYDMLQSRLACINVSEAGLSTAAALTSSSNYRSGEQTFRCPLGSVATGLSRAHDFGNNVISRSYFWLTCRAVGGHVGAATAYVSTGSNNTCKNAWWNTITTTGNQDTGSPLCTSAGEYNEAKCADGSVVTSLRRNAQREFIIGCSTYTSPQ